MIFAYNNVIGKTAGCAKRMVYNIKNWSIVHPWMILVAAMPLLGACGAVDNSVSKANSGLRTSYDNTRQRFARYIYDDHKPEPRPSFVVHPSEFCYQVMMDIVCYDTPQPHLHMNLVGAQGDGVSAYAYDDYLPEKLRGTRASATGYDAGGYGSRASAPSGASDGIMVSDLGGAGGAFTGADGLTQTPFYHSPSPALQDPYGKPKEPMTALEYDSASERSRSTPLQLMKR
jgi:hypothetical protein